MSEGNQESQTFLEYTTSAGGQVVTQREKLPDRKPPPKPLEKGDAPLVTKHITPHAPSGITEGRPHTGQLKVEEPPLPLATKLHTAIKGIAVTAEVLAAAGEKNSTRISINSPYGFGKQSVTVEGTLASPQEISKHSSVAEMLKKAKEESFKVETFPPGAMVPAVATVQVTNYHWPEVIGHPIQDHAKIYAEDGLAVVVVTDGITSYWGHNLKIRSELGQEKENPPLTMAKVAAEAFISHLVQAYRSGSRLNVESIRSILALTNEAVRPQARHLLETYAQIDEKPVNMTAGTTLTAVAYLRGIGLVVVRVGDGLAKLTQKFELLPPPDEAESRQRPLYLGEAQTVPLPQASPDEPASQEPLPPEYTYCHRLEPNIIIIPKEKLAGTFENVPIFVGSDGAAELVSRLSERTISGRFSRPNFDTITSIAKGWVGPLDDDLLLAETSLAELKKLSQHPFPQRSPTKAFARATGALAPASPN